MAVYLHSKKKKKETNPFYLCGLQLLCIRDVVIKDEKKFNCQGIYIKKFEQTNKSKEWSKLMRFDKSTLIGFESRFNWLFRSEFSRLIYRRDDFDSKSQSEFEVRFEFGPRIVEFDRKLVKFESNCWFWSSFLI